MRILIIIGKCAVVSFLFFDILYFVIRNFRFLCNESSAFSSIQVRLLLQIKFTGGDDMEDNAIIDLFFKRSEQAIVETDAKYGGYCYSIAYNILSNREDSQECVSDTYLAAWNAIPPSRPNFFNAFLAKLTRHISIDRWRKTKAKKRGGGELVLALEELENCVGLQDTESTFERKELTRVLDRFLLSLPETERNIFLCRYWYLDSIRAISEYSGFTQSKVTSMLHRTRGKLRKVLSEEGWL